MLTKDISILRDLAKQYIEICEKPVQDERRELWRGQNSLEFTRPLIYIRACAWGEMPQAKCHCEDPFYRGYENFFRNMLFRDSFADDYIMEPWVTVNASHKCAGWGVAGKRQFSGESRGSWKMDYPIKTLEDSKKLRTPRHEIDEDQTARNLARLEEAVGDLITVNLDRGPAHRAWSADLSTDLGYLRGIEHFMLDMSDHPEWLHSLLAFMRDGVLKTQAEAEQAGDWNLSCHENQAMPYARELADPAPNSEPVTRAQLWCFCASQETTGVGPAMFDEFMLQHQLPIIAQFGLVAYGCCEDHTHNINVLRQIPRLRRIAVAPCANVARCAEQIGTDYVISYRPSPTDMVGYGFDPHRIRKIVKADLEACKGCHVDITLKDVETVQGDPNRIRNWVTLVRQIIDELLLC